MQDATIKFLIDTLHKSSRFLQRDFYELEMLQSSNRNPLEFCKRSVNKFKELMLVGLQKLSKDIIFTDETSELKEFDEALIVVEPIDSITNFSKSMPLFGTSICIFQKVRNNLVLSCCVLYLPILEEVFYIKHNQGAWLERNATNTAFRLRVSATNTIGSAVIASDNVCYDFGGDLNNLRSFGSFLYSISLFAGGKIDAFYCNVSDSWCAKWIAKLIAQESGGVYCELQKDKILLSNYNLADKLEHIFKQKANISN